MSQNHKFISFPLSSLILAFMMLQSSVSCANGLSHPIMVTPPSAMTTFMTSPISYLPLQPRITAAATASRHGVFDLEGMAPVYGNNSGILFLDGEGRVGTNSSWMVSPGGGARLVNNNLLYGAYIFGDYNKTSVGGHFWVVNPGIEFMTPTWDVHVNGYFPTRKKKKLNTLGFASDFGINKFVAFSGHTMFDQRIAKYDLVGNGVDGEIGYSLPVYGQRGRVFLGGYHYNPPLVHHITGVQAGVSLPYNQFVSMELADSYDRVFHNTASLSVKVTFGGMGQRMTSDVRDRLVDPIPRHLGTLDQGTGIPSQKKITNTGEVSDTHKNILVHSDIWFFKPGLSSKTSVTAGDCTVEHPCVGINDGVVTSISGITPNALFYFAPGDYPLTASTTEPSALDAAVGQSLFGRTPNYTGAASGASRARLLGALVLPGSNKVDSMRVFSDKVALAKFGRSIVGIGVPTAESGQITLNNVDVTVTGVDAAALEVDSGDVVVKNSNFFTEMSSATSDDVSDGIFTTGTSHVTMENSTATGMNNGPGTIEGLASRDSSVITAKSLTVNVISNGGIAAGVLSTFASKINLDSSVVTANSGGLGSVARAIEADGNSVITVNNTSINSSSSGESVAGVFSSDSAKVALSGGKVTAAISGGSGEVHGLDAEGSNSKITITNTEINAHGGALTLGATASNAATIIFNGGTVTANNGGSGEARGLDATGTSTSITTATGTGINATSSGTFAIGVNSTQGAKVTLNSSQVLANNTGSGEARGLSAADSSSNTTTNTTINVSSVGSAATGVITFNTANTNVNSGTLFVTGGGGATDTSAAGNFGTGVINFNNVGITVTGPAASSSFKGASTGTVNQTGTCTVNGNPC